MSGKVAFIISALETTQISVHNPMISTSSKFSSFQFGHPTQDRGLTIRERCRLQSFPDNFYVYGGIVQGRVQTGNAVPPLLAKAIALAIKKYL